jgi:hypothetical protein
MRLYILHTETGDRIFECKESQPPSDSVATLLNNDNKALFDEMYCKKDLLDMLCAAQFGTVHS